MKYVVYNELSQKRIDYNPDRIHETRADAQSEANRLGTGFKARPQCPDGGVCHHGCSDVCWRVNSCGPISGVFPCDEWPDDIWMDHTNFLKNSKIDRLTRERDHARGNARILAHAYTTDNRPPTRVVEESLAYPVIPTPDT